MIPHVEVSKYRLLGGVREIHGRVSTNGTLTELELIGSPSKGFRKRAWKLQSSLSEGSFRHLKKDHIPGKAKLKTCYPAKKFFHVFVGRKCSCP